MPVRHGPTLALAALVVAASAGPLHAQDSCPSASVQDAEAGWAAYVGNDMRAARRHFEAAVTRCDNDHYARTGLGYVALRDGDEAAAEAAWNRVLRAEPNNVDALVGMGLARWRAGDVDAVRMHFERVLALSPEHPTAVEYLDRIAGAEAAATEPDDPGELAWRAGNTTEAMRIYRARLEADAEDRGALLRVALMTAWQERFAEAIDLLDRLLELQPGHLDARLARARVRAWSGDIPAAQDEVRQLLAVQPDNPEALEALALFQAWSGDFDEALESYDELLAISPSNAGARRQQAQALAWASDFEASRAAYDALIERDPDDVDARMGLARTLAFAADFGAAVDQYDAVLARTPNDLRALMGKARTLGWAGRLSESESVARGATEVDPASSEAWGTLGQVFRWQGRLADAQEALQVAARLAPTNAEVRDQLRSLDRAFAPIARPVVRYESDSEENRMVTTTLVSTVHPVPRLNLRAEGWYRDLDQFPLLSRAYGAMATGRYQLRSGWTLGGGIGASDTDVSDQSAHLDYEVTVRTPVQYAFDATVSWSARALNETAWLAQFGTTASELLFVGRWAPALGWRVDGSLGLGSYEGREPNGRRSFSLSTSRRMTRALSLGVNGRGFSFEKNLNDGYFDPDFYGIVEATGAWISRPGSWTVLVEAAPGVQQVRRGGPVSASFRSNLRLAYRIATGREVSLSFGYSSAGLLSFANAATSADYRYTTLVLGSSWTF